MILETIEILDSNFTLTLDQLRTKVTNGDYDDLLNNYNLIMMISNGLVLINKDDKSCKVIAPIDLENYVKNTDTASADKLGIVKFNNSFGISVNTNGQPFIVKAPQVVIDQRATHGSASYYPIVAENLDYAVRSVRPKVVENTNQDITLTCDVNTIYVLGGISNVTSLSITLPGTGQYGDFIQVDFYSDPSSPTNLTINSNAGITNYDLTPQGDCIYSLYFDWGMAYSSGFSEPYGWRFGYAEYPYAEV